MTTAESEIVQHFDDYAPSYSQVYESDTIFGYFFRRRQQLVRDFLDRVERGGTVLDVGCGPGPYCPEILARGFSYVGLDLAPQMVREGRMRLGHSSLAAFVLGRLQELPFANHSFQAILCLGALEYVTEPQESCAMQELKRVLKPGGILIFSCANKLSPYRVWLRSYNAVKSALGRNTVSLVRDFRLRRFMRILSDNGITATRVTFFAPNLFLTPFEDRYPQTAVLLTSRLEQVTSRWFPALGMAFLVLAETPALEALP